MLFFNLLSVIKSKYCSISKLCLKRQYVINVYTRLTNIIAYLSLDGRVLIAVTYNVSYELYSNVWTVNRLTRYCKYPEPTLLTKLVVSVYSKISLLNCIMWYHMNQTYIS